MTIDSFDLPIDLTGQVALITGGGRGLGRAFAQALAASGAAVAITARSQAEVQETAHHILAAGGQALAFPGDVTDAPTVTHMVAAVEQHFGPIDILVNNAGVITPIGPLWEVDPTAWWHTLDICRRVACRSLWFGVLSLESGTVLPDWLSGGRDAAVWNRGVHVCAWVRAKCHDHIPGRVARRRAVVW